MADPRGPLSSPGSNSPNCRSPYKLNIGRNDAESFPSPRVSDVGGLSLFLPSNSELDEDALSAWAGALKAMGLVGGNVPSPLMGDLTVYSSDEFRMYEFKVRRCMRGRSHDWTDCPFAHPGEKARRRDPRKYSYSGTACPDFRKGACRKGDTCEFSHGVFECWLHPARYRTQPCKDGQNCTRRVCFFAHTKDQLRLLPSALAAAAQQLNEEASGVEGLEKKGTKLSPTSTLLPVGSLSPAASPPASPQGLLLEHQTPSVFRRSSFSSNAGPCLVLPPNVPGAHFHPQHTFPVNPPSACFPNWSSPLRPSGQPSFMGSDHSSGVLPGTESGLEGMFHRELVERNSSFPEMSNSLNRDFTWPGNPAQPRCFPFSLSGESSLDSGYVLSPLGHFQPAPNNFPAYHEEGMTGVGELADSLQALDLQGRESMMREETMFQNPSLPPPHASVRRSFETQWTWRKREEEGLRRMAILSNLESFDERRCFLQREGTADVSFQTWPHAEEVQFQGDCLQFNGVHGLSADSPFGRRLQTDICGEAESPFR